jgi:hypothetical protein
MKHSSDGSRIMDERSVLILYRIFLEMRHRDVAKISLNLKFKARFQKYDKQHVSCFPVKKDTM